MKRGWDAVFCTREFGQTCSNWILLVSLWALFSHKISTLSLYWRISSPVSFSPFFDIFGRTQPFLAERGGRRGLCPRWNLCVVMWCAYDPVLAKRGISLLHMTQTYGCVKADYPRLIREYDKAKKNGSVAKWAEENDIKNPSKRVYSWRQSILKQARKESKQE